MFLLQKERKSEKNSTKACDQWLFTLVDIMVNGSGAFSDAFSHYPRLKFKNFLIDSF